MHAQQAPDREEVERALARIAASDNFRKAERCLRLLRHLTVRRLEGRESELKEYSLGVEVLERPETFDPRTDPAVRLEARRLRLKLAEYYQHEGREDSVVIDLPKGGYAPSFRFQRPPVAPEPAPVAPPPAASKRAISPEILMSAAAVALLAIAGAATYAAVRGGAHRLVPASLAVLRFQDNSPHQELNYFADGLRDGLTSALVHTKGIEVTARVSSGKAVDAHESLMDAARRLRADTVVSGSVSPSGKDIQIVLGLVDAHTGKYLWSKTYQAAAADLPLIERSAASAIARTLGASGDIPVAGLPANAEASELYLHAVALARTRTAEQTREAAHLFDRAIALQPDFAPAYAAAASNCLVGIQNAVLTWTEFGAGCIQLSRKAVELDPTLAEAHSARALAWQAQWKWRECDLELSRAIELDPRSPVPHFRLAYSLTVLRQFAEAEKEIETARALDPSWSAAHGLLGEIYYYERRYGEALDLARRFRAVEPGFFDNLTARVYLAQGNKALALPLLSKSSTAIARAEARAIDGDVQGAYRELQAKLHSEAVPAFEVAAFAALSGMDENTVIGWLEKSFAQHEPDLVSLALDPEFDSIRSSPRVVALLKRLNLAASAHAD